MSVVCLVLCMLLMISAPAVAEAPESERMTIIQLGTWMTRVECKDQVLEIPTADLLFASDAPEDQRFASILAPSNGKCSLRELPNESSRQLQSVLAGTIVLVQHVGEDWTRVWVSGQVGFVRTDCLTFHPPVTGIVGEAVVVRDGRTDGRQMVTLHHIPSSYAPKLVNWPTGTRVIVLTAENGWCEVEANGMRGFIRERHLIMLDKE